MQINKIKCLLLFIFLTACTQMRSIPLPEGISLLEGIEPSGLQSPLWSPDGRKIVASYVIQAMPDFPGSEPRHEVVLIDTKTWEISAINMNTGNLVAEAWSPDSRSFAMFWSDGPNGHGIYVFKVDDPTPIYLSDFWDMSPDWENHVAINDSYLEISKIDTELLNRIKLPAKGSWVVSDWSTNMKLITLIYRQKTEDRFENIYLVDLESGNFSQFTNDEKYFKSAAIVSPDGRLISYLTRRFAEKGIEYQLILSRLDQSCQWIMPINDVVYYAWSPDSQKMFLIGDEGVYLADLNIVFGDDFLSRNNCP